MKTSKVPSSDKHGSSAVSAGACDHFTVQNNFRRPATSRSVYASSGLRMVSRRFTTSGGKNFFLRTLRL